MAPSIGSAGRRGSTKSNKGIKKTSTPARLGAKPHVRTSKTSNAPLPKQQKTKSASGPPKKKRKVYTDEELGLPKLNMITPVGVDKPKGKKKGKVFVDDSESMMTILAIVNADKEGQIESKMLRSRQMEEIREARRKEAETRQEEKKAKLEQTKDSVRKRRKKPHEIFNPKTAATALRPVTSSNAGKKRVSFT